MVAKKFLPQNGRQHQNINRLSASVEKLENTFKDFQLDKYTKFITNAVLKNFEGQTIEQRRLRLNHCGRSPQFRNYLTGAFQNLQLICKAQEPTKDD